MAKITVARIVRVLTKVPEKRFRIMDLAPELLDEKGNVDIVKAIDQQGELNLAIIEVESYIRATRDAAHVLARIDSLGTRQEDTDTEEGIGIAEDEA